MFNSIQNGFSAGELSPNLFGRTDLAKYHLGSSTMRNGFVDYRGGYTSRGGLAYVGTCKQPGTAAPPRDIPFQFNLNQGYALEFGDQYMRVKSNGAYVIETAIPITGATQANPAVITIPLHGYSVGDWIFISGMLGMTNFNGLAWIVNTVPTVNTVTLKDMFGNIVNSTLFNTYTSGGMAARIYTLRTPYAAVDLPFLKYTQSRDTMTLCCLNQDTNKEYPSYELVRHGATNWTITQDSFSAAINAPAGTSVTANSSTTPDTWYSYVVTAVTAAGEESVASNVGTVENNNISINAGSNTITWGAINGASYYRVYKATPSYSVGVPIGAPYGFIGTAFGTTFSDSNIIQDFTDTPPTHNDPFARGSVSQINPTAGGASYTQATIGYTINTSTGSGFVGSPVVVGGAFVVFIIQNPGRNYAPTDTITITDSGSGSGATATLVVGAQSGTYPSVPAYFQQRRVYANTLNEPDTYFMSRPGLFQNMDSSNPTVSDDAIVGAPWAQQVNGIQFMVPMTAGLVVLTGNGAWQLSGGNSVAITPADQNAASQAYNGCHDHIQPIVVNYDILYVQAKGSIIRDLAYNFFVNIYTGTDLTVLSNHLFFDQQIIQWAYAEEPFKLVWTVRENGTFLSLTYLKEQDVYGWARHDTNGLVQGVCSVTEPPVDAVYFIVKRYVQGQWMYYSERMNNRIWNTPEDCFCVDAGLSYPMPQPNATLNASGITGSVTFTASASVFTPANVGDVIRMDGGIGTITAYNSPTSVTATLKQDITQTIPNDPNKMPVPAAPGDWTMTTPTTTVTGLNHLEGLTVSILADGGVVQNQIVTNGGITLPVAASSIVVGLPFVAQLQSLYLDAPAPQGTMQGKRKTVPAVTARVMNSRGYTVGANQKDASVYPNGQIPIWSKETGMRETKQRNAAINAGNAIPLYTGDDYILIPSDWDTRGQIAFQQTYPLPMQILAGIPNWVQGDTPG